LEATVFVLTRTCIAEVSGLFTESLRKISIHNIVSSQWCFAINLGQKHTWPFCKRSNKPCMVWGWLALLPPILHQLAEPQSLTKCKAEGQHANKLLLHGALLLKAPRKELAGNLTTLHKLAHTTAGQLSCKRQTPARQKAPRQRRTDSLLAWIGFPASFSRG
jgi:hypothetical protein